MIPRVSVIVPVYNAGEFLKPCIDSLLCQSLKDIEFIFVNDGSKDSSLQLMKEYGKEDSRIRIIDQPNQGVSVARNNGLDLAKAEFISFVDADDWLPQDIYEKLLLVMDETAVDVVLYNIETTLAGNHSVTSYPFPANKVLDEKFIQETVYKRLISEDDLFSPCNKLYRKSIIEKHNVSFPVGKDLSEDNVFNLEYFGQVKNMYYLNEVGYYYREVEGSATRNLLAKDYLKNYLEIYHFNYRNYFDTNYSDSEIQEFKAKKLLHNVRSMVFFYLTSPGDVSKKQRLKLVKKMLTNKDVVDAVNQFPQLLNNKGKFDQLINLGIKRQNTNLLYVLAKYSEIRSR